MSGQKSVVFHHQTAAEKAQAILRDGFAVTPAMEAGIADHVWSIERIVGLLLNDAASVPLL